MKPDALINQILILFLILFVGFIARKKRLLNTELTSGLTNLLLKVTLPFSIITSFNLKFAPGILHNMIVLFFCALFAHIFSALLSLILYFKYPMANRKILIYATIFANTGFMGLPVLGSIFGPMGIFYGSIYVVVFNILVWTLGVMIFTGKKDLNFVKAFANPALIGVLIGCLIFIFSLRLPVPVFKTFEMVGSMTTPLSMIIIGSMLAELKFKEIFAGFDVYYATIARLLLVPLSVAFLLRFFNIQEQLLKICITSASMPVATLAAMFAEKYKSNTTLASRLIFISTALSIVTIPLVVVII